MSQPLQLRGASRAETPLIRSTRSTQKELTKGLGQAMAGLQEYLASDTGFKRDVRRLGDAVDTAVLASGDRVGCRRGDRRCEGRRGEGHQGGEREGHCAYAGGEEIEARVGRFKFVLEALCGALSFHLLFFCLCHLIFILAG